MKKNLLVLSWASLLMVLLAFSVEAHIILEEKFYTPEPTKIEIPACDWERMVKSLSFEPEKKSTGERDYYDLKSGVHRDRYQEFAVELTDCKIESAEKKENASVRYSYVVYDFTLASFLFDIDLGKTTDGLRKTLSIWVLVKLDAGGFGLSAEEKEFYDGFLRHPEKPISLKGIMKFSTSGKSSNGNQNIMFPSSIGEIVQLEIIIRPSNK